jgi:hypothetical protein
MVAAAYSGWGRSIRREASRFITGSPSLGRGWNDRVIVPSTKTAYKLCSVRCGRSAGPRGLLIRLKHISIIFYAPCLFLHHLLSVLLHFVAFLCIFRNKPINKMPQCQFPIFCYFCVSEKLHRKYSRNWTKQKPNLLIFTEASRSSKRRRRGATGRPHHRVAWPAPVLRPLWVRPPWSTSDAAPSPIKTPRREKPKGPINFPETHCDPPPLSTRDR